MNISKQHVSDLNAIITIEVQPADYQERVNKLVKQYQKSAKVPGFRPGHVPAGMIRKMYGKSMLVDELNQLLSETIGQYIYDNKLEVIGSPLPKKRGEEQVFEEGNNFVFDYEIGLAPTFDVKLPADKIPYYLVKVDEKMVDDDLSDLRRRYGKFSNPDTSEESSILYGEFNELDSAGIIKEGGNKTTTTLAIDMIRDVQKRKPLVGLKKGDVITLNPMDTFGTETEVAAMLKVDQSSEAMTSNYQFTVMTVNKIEKAELNQEFFDKIYGAGVVNSESELRDKIRSGILSYFEKESDRKLKKDLRLRMVEENSIPLPDEFLKRMVKANSEKEVDEHTFDHEYYHMAEDLRWSLIQNKISDAEKITVEEEEVKDAARQMVRQQFAQYGMMDPETDKLEEVTRNYLNSENNADRIARIIKEDKVFNHLKGQVRLDMIELPYTEFIAKLNEKTEHEQLHHH
jgi:trigger factor